MTDALLLRWLARLGMDDLSYRALPVLPLMPVAWADGGVQPEEAAVLRTFAARFSPGPEAWLLLEDWLRHPPSEDYVQRGHAALAALAGRRGRHLSLPGDVLDAVREAGHDVARAHGGLFGLGAVSRSEARALRALDALLSNPPALDPQALGSRRVTVGADGRADAALLTDDRMLPVEESLALPGVAHDGARLFRDGRLWLLDAGRALVRVDGERVGRRRLLGGEVVEVDGSRFTFCLVRRRPQTVTG